MSTPFWTIAVLAALSISALVWSLYGLWRQHLDPRQQALAQRLQSAALNSPGEMAEPALKLRPRRMLSQWDWAERWLQTLPGAAAFDHFLLQTGLALSLAQALLLAAALVLVALALGASLGWPVLLSLVVAVLGPLLLIAFLQQRRARRMTLISQALPDALELMARSMQAGHAFTSALHVAAKDCPPPPCQSSCVRCLRKSTLASVRRRPYKAWPCGWPATICATLRWPSSSKARRAATWPRF